MKIGVFTLTKNRVSYTKKMIDSLEKKTQFIPYDHFFIDQGSTDETIKYLYSLESNPNHNINVYPFSKNIGINRAVNFAIQQMKEYDVIIKLDNDMECLTDKWLLRCLEVLSEKMLISPYIHGLVQNRNGVKRTGVVLDGNIELSYAIGGMVMIGLNRAWTKDSNGWTVPAALHAGGDMDFCAKLALEGYSFGYKKDVIFKHIDTSLGQKGKYKEYFNLRKRERVNVL